MLQERIEELGSAILYFKEDKIFLWGFNDPDRLNAYYLNNSYCHCSQGIYSEQNLNFGRTRDNALFILIKDNNELNRYQFEVLLKDTIKYKNKITNKATTKVYKIRKCKYNELFNLILREKKIINDLEEVFIESYNFESMDLLKNFFFEKFKKEIPLLLI
ncbi:MAG: hypothetical protein ACRC6T_11530 [Sarcina sp.]